MSDQTAHDGSPNQHEEGEGPTRGARNQGTATDHTPIRSRRNRRLQRCPRHYPVHADHRDEGRVHGEAHALTIGPAADCRVPRNRLRGWQGAELSRRVGKVVAYLLLSEMSDVQRREFHEELLDADAFGDLAGNSRRRLNAEQNRPTADRQRRLDAGPPLQRTATPDSGAAFCPLQECDAVSASLALCYRGVARVGHWVGMETAGGR